MTADERTVLDEKRTRFVAAFSLVEASVRRTQRYDPERAYTADEREPFDALSDRFVRAVEAALQFFRAYERFVEGLTGSTMRDTIHKMEKLRLVTDTELWMDMRDVRNRIVHDYAPGQIQQLYSDIRGPFFAELRHMGSAVASLTFELGGKA